MFACVNTLAPKFMLPDNVPILYIFFHFGTIYVLVVVLLFDKKAIYGISPTTCVYVPTNSQSFNVCILPIQSIYPYKMSYFRMLLSICCYFLFFVGISTYLWHVLHLLDILIESLERESYTVDVSSHRTYMYIRR